MNRKTLYWILGIVTALLLVLIIWFAIGKSKVTAPESDNDTAQQTNEHDHMQHDSVEQGNDKLSSYLLEENAGMAKMMQDMEDIPQSGYAAVDFLIGMIPHHEAAVSMSKSYLKYGNHNAALTQLAKDIIDVQEKEIQQMEKMAQDLKESGKLDAEQEKAYLEEYKKMFSSHQMNHTPANNVEAAFAEGMIMHHQMAVEMAEAILNFTDEEEVTALAQNIIETQNQEIAQMQEILKKL